MYFVEDKRLNRRERIWDLDSRDGDIMPVRLGRYELYVGISALFVLKKWENLTSFDALFFACRGFFLSICGALPFACASS